MPIPLPGPYEVSQTIQSILQRRRDESRQAMIDKLDEEQTRAQMSAQTRQLDLQEANNKDDALTNEMQRRASQQQLAVSQQQLDLGQLDAMGDVPQDIEGMDPKLAGLARQFNRVRSVPTQGQAEFPALEPPPALADTSTKDVYMPPAYAKEEDARQRLRGAMDKLRPDMSELERAMLLREAGGIQDIPEEAYAGARRVVPIPWNSSRPVNIGPRDVPLEMNPPPSSYMPSFNPNPLVMPDGRVGFSTTRPGPNGMPSVVFPPELQGASRLGPEGQSEWATTVQTLRNQVANNTRLVGTRKNESLYEADLTAINFRRDASPAAKQAAQAALVTMRKYVEAKQKLPPVTDFMSIVDQGFKLQPQDRAVVEDMITILAPHYTVDSSGSVLDWLF